jgi:hypothetical protein
LTHTLCFSGHARLLLQGSIPTLGRESLPDAEAPVDGGVFDIQGNGSPVVAAPISAKLTLYHFHYKSGGIGEGILVMG